MTPIEGISDIRRMPRLGIKMISQRTEKPYPRATDYFVVPEEIVDYVGEKPKTLDIMFPSEAPEEFAQQWLRCYSFTQGLICKGDGVTAVCKWDIETGAIADRNTKEWVFQQASCKPKECPEYVGDSARGTKPQCRRVMNLLFLLPQVPGLGVWQLDTSSFYSIVNLNSCIDLIKRLCGRISFIPLTLSLEPIEVSPLGEKKKTVHILYIRSEVRLAEIQKLGTVAPEKILLPRLQDEEPPDDLYPQEVLLEAEVEAEAAAAAEQPTEAPQREAAPATEAKDLDEIIEDDIPDLNSCARLCFHYWRTQPQEVAKPMGYKTLNAAIEADVSPWDTFLTIKSLKKGPPKEKEENK